MGNGFDMSNWEKVTQDKELLSKVEDWVRGLSIDSPQEVFDEMNSITGNEWTRKEYELHCFDYPDFYDMEEVVYALFHEGKYPERKSEDLEAWKIGNDDINVKKLYRDLLEAFPGWNEDVDSYENLFYLKNKEVYGFEKSIFIRNVYDRKFLSCTLTNMNQEEKDTFVNVVRKYCNHVVREKIHPHNTATYKMKFMFDWRSGVCLWADNEAAKSKFNGYPVETCDLPISDGLKATLEDLICLYDEAFDFEESNGDLLWDKNQIEEFLCTAGEAYACLCEELGPEYEVEPEFDEYDDILNIEPEEEENKMSIMDRINKSDYVEVFSAILGKMMAAQRRVEEYIEKDQGWEYDFAEGTLSFGEDVYPVQFIGKEKDVWKWAREENHKAFNKCVFGLVNEAYALGEEWKFELLTSPQLEIEDDCNGDHISALCCGISKDNYVYYCVQPEEEYIFLGIGNAPEEVYAPVDRNEFKKIVARGIEAYTIDHKIFLEAFLEWNNTPYEWNGDNVIAHFDKDLVFVFEEDEGDYCITSIKTAIPMNRNDYLRELPNRKIDELKVKQIEELYECTVSEEVKRIISNCDKTIFLDDDYRVLSFEEILEAPETLCELFVENKMIPLFDCMDNDFIVYKADSHKWLMFNTEDEMDFDEAEYLADLWEEEDEGDYSITSIKTVSGSEPTNEQANSRISITLEDGEIKISGKMNLGYIGTFTDEEIEIDDTLDEIREWDIVQDNLDEDCTDEELIAFLNKYFNDFAEKVTRNIDNINGTFLLQTLTDMECNEIDFMEIEELFLEDKLPYGNEEDIAELYNFARDGLRSLVPYLESPNDGCIPKGHIEALLRSFFPAFDFDCFIANIVPEVLTLCDGSIAFQCSDAFDEAILCGAYAELDEELSFKDWHNF